MLITAFVLLLGGLLVIPLADRLRLPWPVLAAALGVLLGLLPGMAVQHLPPHLILPLLLPPLLYAAAQRGSWRQFAASARPVLLLAVALVFVTTAAVGLIAAAISPALPLGAAMVLGVIVSPPDPAVVSAVAGRLGLPRRLVTIMAGEGLFNDVTALTLYQVAVAGVVAGSASVLGTVGWLAYSAVAAVALGLAVGVLAKLLLDRLDSALVRAGLSMLVPYAAYVCADQLRASGVLSVLVTAFYLSGSRVDPADVAGRLYGRAFWGVLELLITGLTFGLVGLEFTTVVRGVGRDAVGLLGHATVVCATVVLVRVAWLFPAAALSRWRRGRGGNAAQRPRDWRETVVLAWAGMRGVASVATALALPLTTDAGAPFPGRDEILFSTVVVVLVTLVLPGLTLPWLIRRLGLGADADRERAARRAVRTAAADAALGRLGELASGGGLPPELADRLVAWQRDLLGGEDVDEDPARHAGLMRTMRSEMLHAAREAVLPLRGRPDIGPDVVDDLLTRLDLHSAGLRPPPHPENRGARR